jgi:hypothetical protein
MRLPTLVPPMSIGCASGELLSVISVFITGNVNLTFDEIAAKTLDVTQSTKMYVRRLRHVVVCSLSIPQMCNAKSAWSENGIH